MSNNSLPIDPPIDWEAKYKRALADLQNQEKEFHQRTSHLIQFAHLDLLKKIIPVYESLSRAAQHDSELTSLEKQFAVILESVGVKKMETIGQSFDPHYHEAVDKRLEAGQRSHLILEEVAPGYLYHNQVLKPAKVIVSI